MEKKQRVRIVFEETKELVVELAKENDPDKRLELRESILNVVHHLETLTLKLIQQ